MQINDENLAAAAGSYAPTFFRMFVDTEDSLGHLLYLSPRNAALYIHEYIHYLQDISTTYGLFNMCANINLMRESTLQIRSTDGSEFYVPIYPTAEDQYQVFQNISLRKTYLGSQNQLELQVEDTVTGIVVDERVVKIGLNDKTVVNVVNIHFSNGLIYEFGATCVMECVAYLAETILYPGAVEPSPTLPYTAAELLVNYVYPEFGLNRLNTVALSDAALLVFHPGDFFYKVLTHMKEEGYLPQSPEDVYEYVDRIDFSYEGQTTIDGILEMMSERASHMLTDYFRDVSFESTVIWIRETFANALELRLNIREFILDIVKGGNFSVNTLFAATLQKVGSPMTINALQEVWFMPCDSSLVVGDIEAMRPDILRAINQVHKLFTGGQTYCEMRTYCQESCEESGRPDITDKRCDSAPWTRADYGSVCAYGQVWQMWNLIGKVPVSRPSA